MVNLLGSFPQPFSIVYTPYSLLQSLPPGVLGAPPFGVEAGSIDGARERKRERDRGRKWVKIEGRMETPPKDTDPPLSHHPDFSTQWPHHGPLNVVSLRTLSNPPFLPPPRRRDFSPAFFSPSSFLPSLRFFHSLVPFALHFYYNFFFVFFLLLFSYSLVYLYQRQAPSFSRRRNTKAHEILLLPFALPLLCAF